MQRRSDKKFCPRCGTPNDVRDAYCIGCGFSFRRRVNKRINPLITIIILLIIGWVFYRTVIKQPIIPNELLNLTKNITLPKFKK